MTQGKRATQILDKILAFYGEEGSTWIQRLPCDFQGRFCLMTALNMFADEPERSWVFGLLWDVLPEPWCSIASYNDHAESFEDIKSLLLAARALARGDEEPSDAISFGITEFSPAAIPVAEKAPPQ
jgi:hypothetical protein